MTGPRRRVQHNSSRSPRSRFDDPIWPVNARTPRTDEGAFQMQAEHPVPASNRARGGDGGPHLLAGIADQRRQAARGAIAPVCPSNGAHSLGGRSIVEQNAATAIDLQIYEARSHK